MKKWIIIGISLVALAALAVAGFAWAGTAYAQAQNPPFPGHPFGMMGQYGGYGMMGGYGLAGAGDYGPMHETMVDALAEALNLTPEEIQTRIDNGETPWEIAQSQGLSQEEIQQVMADAHDQALDKAVEAGLLTQEQADWMDQHMESMWSGDFSGFGGCHSSGSGSSSSGAQFGPGMRGGRGASL